MFSRKQFISMQVVGLIGHYIPNTSLQQKTKIISPTMNTNKLDAEMVQDFVGNCHGNLGRVQELYEKEPRLVFASHDWGGGDFESGIEAAGHTGQKEIAAFLLAKGARVNFFLLCMLGKVQMVKTMIQDFPELVNAKGPHGFTPLHHAIQGGEEAREVRALLESMGAKEDKLVL
jgi:Ankyrin repeat